MNRDDIGGDLADLAWLGMQPETIPVYAHIAGCASWTTEHVAEILGLDLEQVATAMTDLTTLGLVTMPAGAAGAHVVNPRVALSRLLDERDQGIRTAQNELFQARRAASTLIEQSMHLERRQAASLVEFFGPEAIADRIGELLLDARTEVLTMLTTLPSPDALERARVGDLELLARGIQVRILVLAGHLRRSREYVSHLESLEAKGAQVRVAATLPTRVIVADRSSAIVPSDPGDPAAGATVIQQPGLLAVILSAFETSWRDASSLEASASRQVRTGWEPTPLEQEVIRLLGEGNKDEAVARRVGLSLRSIRRVVAQISLELGSDSRFSMGAQCAERGLLTPRGRDSV